MLVHSFDLSEFPGSSVDTGAIHAEYVVAFAPSFTHIERRGDTITVHFSVVQTDEAVRSVVDAHQSSFVPFDPHTDV